MSAWERVKVDLTLAQIVIPTTIKKVLDLGHETLVSGDDLQ